MCGLGGASARSQGCRGAVRNEAGWGVVAHLLQVACGVFQVRLKVTWTVCQVLQTLPSPCHGQAHAVSFGVPSFRDPSRFIKAAAGPGLPTVLCGSHGRAFCGASGVCQAWEQTSSRSDHPAPQGHDLRGHCTLEPRPFSWASVAISHILAFYRNRESCHTQSAPSQSRP